MDSRRAQPLLALGTQPLWGLRTCVCSPADAQAPELPLTTLFWKAIIAHATISCFFSVWAPQGIPVETSCVLVMPWTPGGP